MTLVAAFIYKSHPILLGDTLVSTTGHVGYDVTIPTLLHVNELLPKDSSRRVSHLYQKVVLLSDKACMAWAGSVLQARTLVRELRVNCHLLETSGQMYDFLNGYPQADLSEVEFYIALKVDGGTQHFTNSGLFQLGALGGIFVAGSGTPYFIENFSGHLVKQHTTSINDFSSAIARALTFCGVCFANQVFERMGLEQWWGGAFEVIYNDGIRFQKYGEILYLIWEAVENCAGTLDWSLYPEFLYQTYRGDDLFIWLSTQPPTPSKGFHIGPPDLFEQSSDSGRPSMERPRAVLHSKRIRYADGTVRIAAHCHLIGDNEEVSPIHVAFEGDLIRLVVESGTMNEILQDERKLVTGEIRAWC